MSHKKENGDSAFPYTIPGEYTETGMSLRDWFAGQVLVGLISKGTARFNGGDCQWSFLSYQVADAMLKERDK